MITESFDNTSEAIISPKSIFGEQKRICDLAIGTFSREIWPAMLEKYPNLRRMYDPDDGNTQVLYFEDAEATFSSFTAPAETVKL